MPHDKSAVRIFPGDYVAVVPCNYHKQVIGRVASITEAETCSGKIIFIADLEGVKTDYFNARDCKLVMRSSGVLIQPDPTGATVPGPDGPGEPQPQPDSRETAPEPTATAEAAAPMPEANACPSCS